MVSTNEIVIAIRYEEEGNGNDSDDDEFQNKIVLGKKYKTSDEPKLFNWSIE